MTSDSKSNDPSSVNIKCGDDNRISEVTIFSNQAYITRTARATVGKGTNTIQVEVQPYSIAADSPQASVLGKGELLSVQYKQIPTIWAPRDEVRELDEKKRELQYQQSALDGEIDTLNRQRGFLDSVVDFSGQEVSKKLKTTLPGPESIQQLFDFIGTRFNDLSDQSEALKRKKDDLAYELSQLERRLKQLCMNRNSTAQIIEIQFESTTDQDLNLEVSYLVNQAKWDPVYRADVAGSLDDLSLTMLAKIQQNSGEDWLDCKLLVSNAAPSRGGELPEPQSWYLRPAPPPAAVFEDAMMLGAVAAEAGGAGEDTELTETFEDLDDLAMGEAESTPAAFREAVAQESPIAVEYELTQNTSVPADGSEVLLPLFQRTLAGHFHHYAAPRIDPAAYLVCQAELSDELLPGRLNIHFGGRFVNSSLLGEASAGENLLLNLGPDRLVKVKREKITDKLTETFFGKVDRSTVAREIAYLTVVENRRDENIEVHLLDSIPVPTTDRYVLKGLEMKPEPTEKDWKEREGVMLWKENIEPNATREFATSFHVKYPRDTKPQGL